MSQARLIEWLKSGGPWRSAPEVVETHAAFVFLIGDAAFKLKKSVNLGYLDFSTSAKRRSALEREYRLNRRTARELYRRIVTITDESSGRFALNGAGATVDYLLEMERFPKDALVSEIADRGKLDLALVEKLAHQIASFHGFAEPVLKVDWPAALKRVAEENARDLFAQSPLVFESEILRRHIGKRHDALARVQSVLKHQSSTVRHCHGDLHLANAFVERGRPILFDCLEFDDFYANIPPLYDFAFLLMDLWSRDLKTLANRAFNTWLMDQPDRRWASVLSDLRALPVYLTLRAEIRAKALGRAGRPEEAVRYLDLAGEMLRTRPPRLIAIGGLSGAGKSTVARALAPDVGQVPGAVHLRSDEIRKRLAGVSNDARLPASAYTLEQTHQVYATMDQLARAALDAGHAVIVDAVFAREDERAAIRRVAAELRMPFFGVWLEAPVATMAQRLDARTGDASDADAAVLKKQLDYDLGRIEWRRIDASAPLDDVVKAAQAAITA